MDWFVYWCRDLIYGCNFLFEWLTLPLVDFAGITFSPIALISIGGLTAYLSIAIMKWIL